MLIYKSIWVNVKLSDKNGLFNQMNGTLKDIRFENYVKTSSTSYSGIAGSSNQYGRFENVHVKNMSITIPSSRTSNYIYIGGLVGSATQTVVDSAYVELDIVIEPEIKKQKYA